MSDTTAKIERVFREGVVPPKPVWRIQGNRAVRISPPSVAGVSWTPSRHAWLAGISKKGERGYCKVKYFRTREEAIAQRKAWEEEYYGYCD